MNDHGIFEGVVLFLLAAMVGAQAVAATADRREEPRLQVRLYLSALALRFAASLAIYEFGLVQVLLDEDASGWHGGVYLYQRWTRQGLGLLDLPTALAGAFGTPTRNLGYQHLLGMLFYVTDLPARLPAAVLDNVAGALTVVLVYRIAALLFSPWVARRVGWWSCLTPSLIVWSAQTLKEPVVILLETLALHACIRLRTTRQRGGIPLVCTAAVVLLVAFRFYAAYLTAAVVVLSLAMPRLRDRRPTVGLALVIGGVLATFLIATGLLAQHQAMLESYDLARLQAVRDYTARTAGSGVLVGYDLRSWPGLVASIAVGAAHLLLAPFPWQLAGGSARMLLTVPDVVVWWWLVFAGLVPGLRAVARQRRGDVLPLLGFVLGMGLLYSLTFSNVGLAYRQRAQLLPWLLIFAMAGLEQRVLRRAARGRPKPWELLERWRLRPIGDPDDPLGRPVAITRAG